MKERKQPILLQQERSMTADWDRTNSWSSSCCRQWTACLGQISAKQRYQERDWMRRTYPPVSSPTWSQQALARRAATKTCTFISGRDESELTFQLWVEGKASTKCSFSWGSLQKMHLSALGYLKSKLWALSENWRWKARTNKGFLYDTRVPQIKELSGHP